MLFSIEWDIFLYVEVFRTDISLTSMVLDLLFTNINHINYINVSSSMGKKTFLLTNIIKYTKKQILC